jgi:hypothetical protein
VRDPNPNFWIVIYKWRRCNIFSTGKHCIKDPSLFYLKDFKSVIDLLKVWTDWLKMKLSRSYVVGTCMYWIIRFTGTSWVMVICSPLDVLHFGSRPWFYHRFPHGAAPAQLQHLAYLPLSAIWIYNAMYKHLEWHYIVSFWWKDIASMEDTFALPLIWMQSMYRNEIHAYLRCLGQACDGSSH